jgi:hypothetical protein
MSWKETIIKEKCLAKHKVIPTLYVHDEEGKYGVLKRTFFECTLKFDIWDAEPFSDDYIMAFLSRPKIQEMGEAVGIWTVKIFRIHFHDASRGFSSYEADNRSTDGITVKREDDHEISKEEFETKLKTHKYHIAQEDGGNLIALKMYIT